MTQFWPIISAVVPAIALAATWLGWFVKTTFAVMLAKSNAELLARFEGAFVRSAGSTLTGAEIGRDLDGLKAEFQQFKLLQASRARVADHS